ncbi:MAG: hypothetical protein AAF352_08670, partial [Pseudomonadota bacterium]
SKIRSPFMWLPLLLMIGVAACGFRPAHLGANDAAQGNIQLLRINSIPERDGQKLRNALNDRLYIGKPAQTPKFSLSVKLAYSEQSFGIQRSGSANALRASMDAHVVVVSLDNYQPLQEFKLTRSTHFLSRGATVSPLITPAKISRMR